MTFFFNLNFGKFSNLDFRKSDIAIFENPISRYQDAQNHDIDISRFLIPESRFFDSDQNRDIAGQVPSTFRSAVLLGALARPDRDLKRGDNTERVTMYGKGYNACFV